MMAVQEEINIPIPPKPDGQEPELLPGWRWLPSDWLAYWMMTGPIPLQDEFRNPKQPYPPSLIKTHMDVLRWWESHERGRVVFERILATHDTEKICQNLSAWIEDVGMEDLANRVVHPPVISRFERITRGDILFLYTAKCHPQPIELEAKSHQITHGRHRVYAAWKHDAPEVFLLVE